MTKDKNLKWFRALIEFSYDPDTVPQDQLDILFDSIADLAFDWTGDYEIDPLVSANLDTPVPDDFNDDT